MSNAEAKPACERLTDFDSADENRQWVVVNDNVMGGRSLGGLTFDDAVPARDRRVWHRAPIGFTTPGGWQTVSVEFADLFPAIFGRPIDDLPFRKDLATRMGLMISDGFDGPFQLEVDWIDLC